MIIIENDLKPGEVPLLSDGDPEVEACKPLVRRDVHCVLVHTCEYHYHCDNYDDYGTVTIITMINYDDNEAHHVFVHTWFISSPWMVMMIKLVMMIIDQIKVVLIGKNRIYEI